MKRTLILTLSILLAIGGLLNRPGTAAASETTDLFTAINTYRQGLGLTAIPLSPQLTAVAKAHVQDLMANFATDPNYTGAGCVPHGWSSQGQWTGGCYKFEDPTTFPIMWNKPKEIANYSGSGFEILFGTTGITATATAALQAWQADPPHNDVIVNQGIWQDHPWQAIGVWVEDGWASVWFGEQTDPTAAQATTNDAGQPAGTGGTVGTTNGDNEGTTKGNDNGATNGGNNANGGGNNQNAGDNKTPPCVDAEELAFLTLINDYRTSKGLQPYSLSPSLTAAARAHSQDMATKNYFDHIGLDGSTFGQRIAAAGYPEANATGENIFAGDQTAAGAFASWKNSPPHNANMLSTTSSAIGIGRAFDAKSTFGWYWTTTFGSKVEDAPCNGPQANEPQTGTGTGTDNGGGTGTDNGGAGTDNGGGTDTTNGGGTDNGQTDDTGDGQQTDTNTGDNGQTNDGNAGDTGTGQGDTGDQGTDQGNTGNGGGDATSDRDGDGLLDTDETDFYGTNPDAFDTDGGGIGDGDEVFNGTDPFDPSDDNGGGGGDTGGTADQPDSDGDGLFDDDETNFFGTDPQNFDTDGDGVGDGDEVFNGTDPLDPSTF